MNNFIAKVKDFWNKGKMQKGIIIVGAVFIIGIISSFFVEKEQKFEFTLTLSDKTINVGESFSYDIETNPKDADIDDYNLSINYSDTLLEPSSDRTKFKAISGGETTVYATLTKGKKEVKSNEVKIKIEEIVTSISAKYTGSTTAGTAITDKANIYVTGITETGKEITVYDWYVDNPGTLAAEETTTFSIKYKDLSCDLQITCTSLKPMSIGQSNAYKSAQSYLRSSSFSRTGLIKQLQFEGFSEADSTFAVDKTNTDWNEQAAKSAQSYLRSSSFSRSSLISQLKFEGFSEEQAIYGVTAVGY